MKFIHRRTPWKSPPFGDFMFHASFPYKFLLIRRKTTDVSITLPLAFGLETVFVNFRAADKTFLLEKASSMEDTMDALTRCSMIFCCRGTFRFTCPFDSEISKSSMAGISSQDSLSKKQKNIKQQLDAWELFAWYRSASLLQRSQVYFGSPTNIS